LHGSVNWKLGSSEIEYDHDLVQLTQVTAGKLSSKEILTDVDFELGELIKHISKKALSKSANHDKFLNEYNKLVMINPTKSKFETTTRDLTFYELLRMYSNHLERENSVLFVIGFSFADEHIREITKRVASSNPTLMIVIFAYDKSSHQAMKIYLNEFPNVKYVIDDTDKIKYTLKVINENFFSKLARELNNEDDR
jgi:hemerythrin